MGLERQLFVGTMSFYFLIINLAKLPFFFDLGVFSPTSILLSLLVLPILPIGIFLGKFLNRTLSDKMFYHISHFAHTKNLYVFVGTQIPLPANIASTPSLAIL